jgi:gliding motility-associated lipoprotein GldH
MRLLRFPVLFLFIPGIFLILSGCDPNRHFEENKSIPGGVWNRDDRIVFMVNVTDTAAAYDLFLNIRNSGDYPYSNLYLFIHTRWPDGRTAHDTVECQLASYEGKWLGSGIGSVKFNRFLFQKGVVFRLPGTYLFEMEQAMRETGLKGIRDIGLRIGKRKT